MAPAVADLARSAQSIPYCQIIPATPLPLPFAACVAYHRSLQNGVILKLEK
jgi:hypothetical protein